MFSLKSSFGSFTSGSASGSSSTASSPTRSFHSEDRQRIEDLEQQLQQLSTTAAKALDRVSELESELQSRGSGFMAPRSDSSCSISSVGSNSERIEKLEVALAAIHNARSKLSSPENYRYI